jgi:hypothetical protein
MKYNPMRPAYVRIDLGDPAHKEPPSFGISPVPFLYHEGELPIPTETKMAGAESYSALYAVLKNEFRILDAMLASSVRRREWMEPFRPSEVVYFSFSTSWNSSDSDIMSAFDQNSVDKSV